MTERIRNLLERTFEKEQRAFRRDVDWKPLLARFIADGTRDEARARIGLEEMLKAETPAFMDGERLAFLRTVSHRRFAMDWTPGSRRYIPASTRQRPQTTRRAWSFSKTRRCP